MPVLDIVSRTSAAGRPAIQVFAIKAAKDPLVMLGVADLFAQRNIVPRQLCCRQAENCLLIDVEVALSTPEAATRVLEAIRSLALVERVSLVDGSC